MRVQVWNTINKIMYRPTEEQYRAAMELGQLLSQNRYQIISTYEIYYIDLDSFMIK